VSCYCDPWDAPSLFSSKMVKARKPHRCVECGDTIVPGETYERTKQMYDGSFDSYATCDCCVDQRDTLMSQTGAECWLVGGLQEALQEAYR